MSEAAATGPLSTAQLDFFDQEGFLVMENLFSPADLQPVIDAIGEEVDRKARDLVVSGDLSRTYDEEGFETQLAHISAETDKVARAIWNGNLVIPAFFNLIANPRLLDVAEQLCGPELIASSVYRLRPKVPNHSMGPVPWHQDSGYFEPYCDHALVLTVWLPLVDATEERGCLWVLPRAHQREVFRHTTAIGHPYLEIPEGTLPPDDAICVPVRKGSALLLTNRTPHASIENRTGVVRWSMVLRYQSAGLPTNAPITRLDGEIQSLESDGIPPACYPPEADFLVRSRLRPGEVVTDPEVFRHLRENHVAQPVTNRWG